MRKTTAMLAIFAAATAGLATAAPQGMAPYPGQAGSYAAPPPNSPGMQQQGPSGGAAEAPRKKSSCVWTRRISGWSTVDDYQMIVRQGAKRYLVTFNGRCKAQRYEHAIKITRPWGSCLSPGDTVEFTSFFGDSYRHRSILDTCVISKVELAPDRMAQR